MLEVLIFILGISFILVSLFLTYHQDKLINDEILTDYIQLNKELKKREQKLEELIKDLDNRFDNTLDKIESKELELKSSLQDKRTNGDRDEKFADTLESKMNIQSKPKSPAQRLKELKAAQDNEQPKEENAINSSNEQYQQIAKLFKEGFDLAQIAQRLDLGQREVELIWKLNNRGES